MECAVHSHVQWACFLMWPRLILRTTVRWPGLLHHNFIDQDEREKCPVAFQSFLINAWTFAYGFLLETVILYFWRRCRSHLQKSEMQKGNFFLSSLQCDAVSVLEKEHDYREEHFDFIQSHLRRFCLQCILGVLCQGPGAQASFQKEHLQRDKVIPESRIPE